jgi:hypothetical protein
MRHEQGAAAVALQPKLVQGFADWLACAYLFLVFAPQAANRLAAAKDSGLV